MSLSIAIAHIVANEDGTSMGLWGPFSIRTAFQPIFRFHEGKLSVTAFEALVRPFREGEPITLASFFAAIPAVDRLSVETLMRSIHILNAGACLPKDAEIFVNWDPSILVERSIAQSALHDMRIVLSQAGMHPRRVVCEVTEQVSGSQEALFSFVAALRKSGFRIAVDDYGSDDSDISRIRALSPDIVKFDGRWISRLMDTGPGFALLRTMANTFAEQRIETVFEGIEADWQLELAERAGATMVQGYVLAKPEVVPTTFSVFRPQPALVRPEAPSPVEKRTAPLVPLVRPAKSFGRRMAG